MQSHLLLPHIQPTLPVHQVVVGAHPRSHYQKKCILHPFLRQPPRLIPFSMYMITHFTSLRCRITVNAGSTQPYINYVWASCLPLYRLGWKVHLHVHH